MTEKQVHQVLGGTTAVKVNLLFLLLLLGICVASAGASPGTSPLESYMAASGDPSAASERIQPWGLAKNGLQDFELGWQGWYADNGVWEVGKPTAGPGRAYSGTNCAGTILNGNYDGYQDSRLISPQMQLPKVAPGEEILLRFRHWWSYYGYLGTDQGQVQIQTYDATGAKWSSWTVLKDVFLGDYTWTQALVDLTGYAGKRVRVGFYHTANDDSHVAAGWYIDDVEIIKQAVPMFSGFEDFEDGWDGWWCDCGVWEVGKPTSGPGGAYSGTNCAGTILNGNYDAYADSRLISPQVQLPQVAPGEEIVLRFRHWWSYHGYLGTDQGQVQIQTYDATGAKWSSWTVLKDVFLADYTWTQALVDLTGYAGKRVRVGFYHTANDDSHVDAGWYIDDVEIHKQAVPMFSGFEDFEDGWDGWWCDYGVWEVGKPTSGPKRAYSGTKCAATILNGDYAGYPDSMLVSPQVQLPQVAPGEEILLRFRHWWSYYGPDQGQVRIQTYDATGAKWSSWTVLKDVFLGDYTWTQALVDLTGYAGKRVRVGFYHTANDDSHVAAGWYIDDVQIVGFPLALSKWSVSGDGGFSTGDKLTNDATPELTFVFSAETYGAADDVQIVDPNGVPAVPASITGWGSNRVIASFTTPLKDGQYTVTLKALITNLYGKPLNDGVDEVVHFTLHTTAPDANDARNLVKNGDFESGVNPPTAEKAVVVLAKGSTDLAHWDVTHYTVNWTDESDFTDAGKGERFADLSSTETGKGALSQVIETEPNTLYYVWLDVAPNPSGDLGERALVVSATGVSEEFRLDSAAKVGGNRGDRKPWPVQWQKKIWSFMAREKTTTLTFAGQDDRSTPFSVAIDNVIVLPSGAPQRPLLIVKVIDVDTSNCPTVQATVIVTDLNDVAVGGLDASNFSVYEDGHARVPATVQSKLPISVSLVLDCSGSMGLDSDPNSALTKLKGAAKAFVDLMRPEQDRGEIIKFATYVEVMRDGYTSDPCSLKAAIDDPMKIEDKTRQTALYNAVYDAISHTAEQPYNRAVVAMSDGEDTVSSRTVDEVIALARTLGVPVYTIGLCTDTNDEPCTLTEKGERALTRIADETGGLYTKVLDPNQLKGLYEKMAGMLKNQYLVTYDSVACLAGDAAASEHVLDIQVVTGAAQGQGTKTFNCPTACKQ